MDVSACKAVVGFHLPRLMSFLAIGHWRITPAFERLDGTSAGQCWPDPDYESARILFDAEKFEDDPGVEDQVVRLIVHELFHVIAAPFVLYQRSVNKILEGLDESAAWDALVPVLAHAEEQVAINLERIWDKHLSAIYYDEITRP